jgi:hypothetical protein
MFTTFFVFLNIFTVLLPCSSLPLLCVRVPNCAHYEYELRMFENRVPRRKFALKRCQKIGD